MLALGMGRVKRTVPAREKATRNAKQSIIKILRGCGSWQCGCKNLHSVPFAVEGKMWFGKNKTYTCPKGDWFVC